jgi:hypothetical protein
MLRLHLYLEQLCVIAAANPAAQRTAWSAV